MSERPQHPSGKPIREPKRGVLSMWRIPPDGPVIPRLRATDCETNAIGFTASIRSGDDDK